MKILLPLRTLTAFLVWFTLHSSTFAQGTNSPTVSAPVRAISIEVAVLRFKPAKAERILQGFKQLKGDFVSAIDSLKPDGEVSVLYTGTRDLRLEDKNRTKFDAQELRPVIIIGKAGAPLPPATAYGVKLEVNARPMVGERFGLNWEGEVSWSPEIVDKWRGEKFLSFASTTVNALNKAGVLGKEATGGSDIGLNLAQLFNPKGKPTDNEIYELPVNKTVSFVSSRNCQSGELIVNATTAEMGNKEAQTILLLILPTIVP